MTKIHWIGAALMLSSLAVGYRVVAQHRRLVDLRTEREHLVARFENGGLATAAPAGTPAPDSVESTSSELLRLRSEVNQLAERKRGLAGVSNEHVHLVNEISSRQTNGPGSRLPVGYIRKRDAQLVGYTSPEDTIQSFLWALQNRDLTNVLQALTPTMADQMGFLRTEKPTEELFKEMEVLPGMRVVSKRLLADDLVELQVEMVPGMAPEPMRFRRVEGHWKIGTEQ